jgi:hypothetical protein
MQPSTQNMQSNYKPIRPKHTVHYPILTRTLIQPTPLLQSSELFEASFMATSQLLNCVNPQVSNKFFYTIRVRGFRTSDASQKHEWPTSLTSIQVNNTTAPLRKREYSRTPDNLIRTTGENNPLEINTFVQVGTNLVKLHFNDSSNFNGPDSERGQFSVAIEVFAWVTREEAIATVLTGQKIVKAEFDEMVHRLFHPDDDECMIVQTSLEQSLSCPLTLLRMKFPVKSRECNHLNVNVIDLVF